MERSSGAPCLLRHSQEWPPTPHLLTDTSWTHTLQGSLGGGRRLRQPSPSHPLPLHCSSSLHHSLIPLPSHPPPPSPTFIFTSPTPHSPPPKLTPPHLAQLRVMQIPDGRKVKIIKSVACRWRDIRVLLDFDAT